LERPCRQMGIRGELIHTSISRGKVKESATWVYYKEMKQKKVALEAKLAEVSAAFDTKRYAIKAALQVVQQRAGDLQLADF